MFGGSYDRLMLSGLICVLLSRSVRAQSIREESCPASYKADLLSVAVVIDSVEFAENIVLTPEIRGRLLDDLKQGNLHASSSADMDWRDDFAEKVQLALQDQGYFKALVEVSSGLIRAEVRRLHYWLSVRAESGPQYRVREVKFENAAEFSLSKLRAQVPLEEGDLFSVPKVREALDNLRRLYGKLGYIDFTTEPQTDIDDDAHRIDLTLKLNVGKKYRVRSVAIHGFDAAVEKRLRSKIEAGQVFDSAALNDFFEANRAALASGENGVSIVRDVQNGLVDLVFEPHRCNTP